MLEQTKIIGLIGYRETRARLACRGDVHERDNPRSPALTRWES